MTIPDQSHINRVREALWQRPQGCASVMVGAGFSRNARKSRPDANEFPLWHDVAMLLCTKLYPSGDGDRLKRAMTEASGTSGFLRLAQEYEAAFGRVALNQLIKEMIPDDDYVPEDMHIRLLSLPWRNLYTTNWDTLLERTRLLVDDRAYSVVHTSEEIPLAPKPHIVKLHGSFPAYVPFIFTEEDYRTYPKRFAPFVNTVQQAMMETVFCLIGFSGDDPNFLHWSGWVRDNLGESAPKIYLAGWLDLSPHRRRMLEERNVVPIDLALHPKAGSWAEHLRHRNATEWILHTLERGRPYEVTEWPVKRDWGYFPVPENIQPIQDVSVGMPVEEPRLKLGPTKQKNLQEQVVAIVHAWKHNRNVYPGWLFIPPGMRLQVEIPTREWEQAILQSISGLSSIEGLSAIRELVWRRQNLLEPLSEQVETAIQSILDAIDCQNRQIGSSKAASAPWSDIREGWRGLAMVLLTAARERLDCDSFSRRLDALQPFIGDHPDVAQHVHQEKCLWALYNLDFSALNDLLRAWHPESCDPAWMTRKAAILIEINREDEAIRLINRSLSIVREAQRGGDKLASQSREGWTLWMALALGSGFKKPKGETVEAPHAFERWKQLAMLECNAFVQKQDFLSAMRSDSQKKEGPPFDLGARRYKITRYSGADHRRWVAARRAIRLCEVAGLPPTVSNVVVASDILALAADQIAGTEYALASRLALRLATSENDATLNRVWSRSRIAAMPMEEVTALCDIAQNLLNYALPRAFGTDPSSEFMETKLRIAMEALSRLVLRLPPERAEDIFKQALQYNRMERVVKHPWLVKSASNLLARSWESIPKLRRTGLIFKLLSSPISGIDGVEPFNQFDLDPWKLLNDVDADSVPDRKAETEERWAEIIRLIMRGLRGNQNARKHAASRLVFLTLWGRMTEIEMIAVSQALWGNDYTGSDTLPGGTSLLDWTFLILPEPQQGMAEERFRKKWLGFQKFNNENECNKYFWELGIALSGLKRQRRLLKMEKDECANVVATVEEWLKFPVKSDDNLIDKINISQGIEGLQFILPEIDLSSSSAEALFTKVLTLNQTNTPGFRLSASIAKFLPDRLDDIAMSMRIGLASDNAALAEAAVLGLHAWLEAASEIAYQTPDPPADLIREIGVIIATRRGGGLFQALRVARWIFFNGSTAQRDAISQLTLEGLRYLMEELRYDRDHGEDGDIEIPLLRWGSAHLALAMSASEYEADPTVKKWVRVAQDDPLPEVRHAEGSPVIRMSK